MNKRDQEERKLVNILETSTPEELVELWGAVFKGITTEEAQEASQGLLAIMKYEGDSIQEIDRLCDEQEAREKRLSEKYGGSVWEV